MSYVDDELTPGQKKTIKAIIIAAVVFLCGIITTCNSCSIVQQRERGIQYTLGQMTGDVIQPGMKWHAPFVSKIKKYSIVPKEYQVTFGTGQDGAITKDLQTVGTTVNIKYAFDETRIKEIALKYGDSIIESAMKTKTQSSVKAVVGTYSIYDLVEKQTEVSQKIASNIINEMTMYPIVISTIDVVNWDWSDDFDKQIKQTAERTQQVKTATQEAEIAAANAMKRVKEAEADKQAAELQAAAAVAKAKGEAEAAKITADATAYTNQKIAQNQSVETAKWKHEEEMKRLEKWNGQYVPDYIPITAAGGIVNLPTKVQ